MLAQITSVEELQSAISLMRLGHAALYVGLAATLALTGLAALSILRKDERLAHAARRGQYALMLLAGLCCLLLYVGIFNGYYFVNYIERVTENNEVATFKIAALWASQQGSLLFWCFILTLVGSAFSFSQRHNRTDRRLPYVLAVLSVVQFFFFFIMTSPTDAEAAQRSSPFSIMYDWMVMTMQTGDGVSMGYAGGYTIAEALGNQAMRAPSHGWDILRAAFAGGLADMRIEDLHRAITSNPGSLPEEVQAILLHQVSDGNGMNPALHNYWIAIHPPMLYLGYVGFTVPFAYAVGSLLSGEVHEGWLRPIRLWTMAAWGFLTVGIAMGGLWAYEILGWGGYWAWDPVENASFVPWLLATAFIHSVIVTERRGLLRTWSFALIIATYCTTILGTFLVRTGIINSVHAFGATGDVNVWFYMFIVLVFLGPLLAVVWRAPLMKPDRRLDSLISREGSFLFNNLIFVAIAIVTMVITFWPLISEQLYGEMGKEELGQDAYVMINVPLFLLILVLMGIGPALAWQRNSWRQMGRTFAAPVLAAVVVGAVNGWWLMHHDLLVNTEHVDTIARLSAWVRVLIQITLWPICAFVFVCIVMEFVSGAKARARGSRENFATALLSITLKNRRRYGGYIVHLGVLLISIGIYYSSLYEAEGTVVTQPGGYGVLTDKLTGNEFLVVFEDGDRTESWDFLRDAFDQSEQQQELYKNMLRMVRMNPELSANEIIEGIRQDMLDQNNGQLPPMLAQALPRMIQAIHWGVQQRDAEVHAVYEEYNSVLRVYRYRSPEALDLGAYIEAHNATQGLLLPRMDGVRSERDAGMVLARLLINDALLDRTNFPARMAEGRENFLSVSAEEFLERTGLAAMAGDLPPESLDKIRPALTDVLDEFERAYAEQVMLAVTLGAELHKVHRQLREAASTMPLEAFGELFNLSASDPEFATRRFRMLESLESWHRLIEVQTTLRRNDLVRTLALDIANDASRDTLAQMRPLTGTGLLRALEVADDATAALIEAELDEVLKGAVTVAPRMRIFYDKRTGVPRMNEPLKDPVYHRTLSRDLYFILQDVRADGTATFRFFVKPHMTLGLVGLLVLVFGTVLAFLPSLPRRRRP